MWDKANQIFCLIDYLHWQNRMCGSLVMQITYLICFKIQFRLKILDTKIGWNKGKNENLSIL